MKKKRQTSETVNGRTLTAHLERKIEAHNGWVRSVAISPDGKWAVSGSDDNTIKTWDLESGRCLTTMEGHKGFVCSVAITPDRMHILSGSRDNTIRQWDAGTGSHLLTYNGHTGSIQSIAILPDGDRALSGSWDRTLKLWDIDFGKCLKTISGHKEAIFCVAAAKDGKHAISGDYNGTLTYWDLETGKCRATLTGHATVVYSVQFTPDGLRAISGSLDKTVKLWNLEAGTCVGTFEGHQNEVHSVAISPDGTLAASTGFYDHTIRTWDLKTGACLLVIKEEQDRFMPISVTFSPDRSRLVAGNAYGEIYIYRLTLVGTARQAAGERYTNAKVVLVGESGVGKSGLTYRLIDDKYIKTDSTHGMNVRRLDLPIRKENNIQKEALLWDLAGQEDYRLIHQLFLDETALALVLFNPQKEDPFTEVADWVKALDAAVKSGGRRVPKLLVAARTDMGNIKVSQKKIDGLMKETGFAAYLDTSAQTGHNCSDSLNNHRPSALKELITRHIPWSALPWTSAPPLLRELKNVVMELKNNENTRLLRLPELLRHLKQTLPGQTFSESDARTAVTLLANHGLVQSLTFGDLVLLTPELMNGYASAVVRAARSHTDEIGCVAESDIFNRTFDLQGVDRLPGEEEKLLMHAMVETFLDKSLCIAEETADGKQLVFPSQYRRERPIPGHPEICVSYTFTGEPATVYTTLVVRLWYSREFDNKELWKNAAEFKTVKGSLAGVVIERTGEGEGTVCVFFDAGFPDDLKIVFIEYVHRHLYKYANDVRRDRRYICDNCRKLVTDTETVRERLAAGKTFIYCQKCDEKIQLIDDIEKRLGTDPVARKVLEMEERAEQTLDNQALEQILIGHMLAICGEANQIFRPVSMFDHGIDGEVEFKEKNGRATGRKVYVQLKSGISHLRQRKQDDQLIFDVKNPNHINYWQTQPVDVYLVIRDTSGRFGHEETIRWMNVTRYLKTRKDKTSKQIVFDGEKLDAASVLRLRETTAAPVPG